MKGNQLRLLILGTGNMANSHAARFAEIPGVQLAGAVDSRPEVLAEFCRKFGIRKQFTDLQAALDWGKFDAVTNVTPDAVHYATTMQALAAGKHVLCEKPLATDHALADEMRDAATAAGVVNMVNLSYRNVPALQHAARMVAEGAIGPVRHFEASYLQSWLTQPAWGDWRSEATWLWRLSTLHGSKGVLGDIGIHILDFATFVARSPVSSVSCRLATFDKAEGGRIGDYVLDANDGFAMHLQLADGAIGTVSATRFASGHHNDLKLRIFGDLGGLEVGFEKGVSRLRGCLGPEAMLKAEWQDIDCPPVPTIYERFVAAVRGISPAEPDFARGAALQQVLDLADRSSHDDCRSLLVGQSGVDEAAMVG